MDDQIITANNGKFEDPHLTAEGAARAKVAFTHPETLWFNTGTLCNIKCVLIAILNLHQKMMRSFT